VPITEHRVVCVSNVVCLQD